LQFLFFTMPEMYLYNSVQCDSGIVGKRFVPNTT
jgi:hypothetical protein